MRKEIYALLLVLLASSSLSVDNSNAKHINPEAKVASRGEKNAHTIPNHDKNPLSDRGKRSINHDFDSPKLTRMVLPGSLTKNNKQFQREDDDPFWANRGRRQSDEDLLGNPGKEHIRRPQTEDDPFWANRGRRNSDEENDLGYMQRLKTMIPGITEDYQRFRQDQDEEDPFWANRGRRDMDLEDYRLRNVENDELPFWGNRGRRENSFFGNRRLPTQAGRGRRDNTEPFWGNRGRRQSLKEVIADAITDVENNIEHMNSDNSFWKNRGRDSVLQRMFANDDAVKKYGATIKDDTMFAEQPHYILVERSSRSSGEDDPFFISRGKKENMKEWVKAVRDRRGAIEDIFKSVQSDPYFIARGKRETITKNMEFDKAKELMCSTMNLFNGRKKRETDNDRGRRAALKQLAAQLQSDPYFVSRGKRYPQMNNQDFMKFVSLLCN